MLPFPEDLTVALHHYLTWDLGWHSSPPLSLRGTNPPGAVPTDGKILTRYVWLQGEYTTTIRKEILLTEISASINRHHTRRVNMGKVLSRTQGKFY